MDTPFTTSLQLDQIRMINYHLQQRLHYIWHARAQAPQRGSGSRTTCTWEGIASLPRFSLHRSSEDFVLSDVFSKV